MRPDPATPSPFIPPPAWPWLLLLFLAISACADRFKDFNPDQIPAIPEVRLAEYADTSVTLPRLEALTNDRRRVDSLIYYAEWLRNYDEEISYLYAQQAYDIATDRNWKYARAISAHRLAVLKEKKAKYGEDIEDAMIDANIAKRIFDQTNRTDWKVWIYSLIGRLHFRRNAVDSAQYYLKWSLDRIDETSVSKRGKMTLKGGVQHDLANTYSLRDSQKIIHYFTQSDSLFQLLGNDSDRARLWIDLGQFFIKQGKYNAADSLFRLSLKYGHRLKDSEVLIRSYQGKGYLSSLYYYYSSNDDYFTNALSDYYKCLGIQKENLYSTYELIGWVYYTRWGVHKYESDVDSILIYYKSAVEEARKEGALNALKSASSAIANLCEFEGKWSKCNQILGTKTIDFINDNYSGVVDTITYYSKAAYKRTNQVEQREIVESAFRQRQNLLMIGLGIFIIASLVFLIILQQVQQKRLKARMEALRAQINPHFFSNSLNAIENLVNMDRRQEASKYIIHFSRLSRQILNRSREPNTTLDEELKTLKHFLELEKLRFRDKLTYDISVDPDINPGRITVPGLILQPYAENAILHGIKPKKGSGHLQIHAKKNGKKLLCIIEDDGIGRKRSRELKNSSILKHKSMGMDITRERMQTLGKVKGSQVEIVDLTDEQGEALGTRIILQLPLKYKKDKK